MPADLLPYFGPLESSTIQDDDGCSTLVLVVPTMLPDGKPLIATNLLPYAKIAQLDFVSR